MQKSVFSFPRFRSLLLRDLRASKHAWMVILFTLVALGFLGSLFNCGNKSVYSAAVIVMFSFYAFCLVVPFVFSSRIFANMERKPDRIRFLMLPASRAEKFWVRLINQSLLPAVVMGLASFVFSFLWISALYKDVWSTFYGLVLYYSSLIPFYVLFGLALPVWCGIFFKTKVLFKTILVSWLAVSVFAIFAIFGRIFIFPLVNLICGVISLGASVFLFRVSFNLFCDKTV